MDYDYEEAPHLPQGLGENNHPSRNQEHIDYRYSEFDPNLHNT